MERETTKSVSFNAISKRSRYMWIHLRSKDQLNKLKERLLIILRFFTFFEDFFLDRRVCWLLLFSLCRAASRCCPASHLLFFHLTFFLYFTLYSNKFVCHISWVVCRFFFLRFFGAAFLRLIIPRRHTRSAKSWWMNKTLFILIKRSNSGDMCAALLIFSAEHCASTHISGRCLMCRLSIFFLLFLLLLLWIICDLWQFISPWKFPFRPGLKSHGASSELYKKGSHRAHGKSTSTLNKKTQRMPTCDVRDMDDVRSQE